MSHREGSGLSLGRPRGCVVRGARHRAEQPLPPPRVGFCSAASATCVAHPASGPSLSLQVQLHQMSLAH